MAAAPASEVAAGKYRLDRLLARGGMGAVWEGVHPTLEQRVAIKLIDAGLHASAEARRRFDDEARVLARLRSRHIVRIIDHGEASDGRPYMVLERLEGEPLDERLGREGRLSLGETCAIVLQVARALEVAHTAGIVHRDLKPDNIFLAKSPDSDEVIAKVLDFGIAKLTERPEAESSNTRTGTVLGTPTYMSPEQARGLRSVDHRTDLWALGVIAFQCVTGKPPFAGEAFGDLLVRICVDPIPVPSSRRPELPPAFDAWMARALERDPGLRFGTAAELATALAEACGVDAAMARASAIPAAMSGAARDRDDAPTIRAMRVSREPKVPREAAAVVVALALVTLGSFGAARWLATRGARPADAAPPATSAATAETAATANSAAPANGAATVASTAPASSAATVASAATVTSTAPSTSRPHGLAPRAPRVPRPVDLGY